MNASIAPLPRVGGAYIAGQAHPVFDLVVTARGPGGRRKGVYSVGVTVTPADDDFNPLYNGSGNIEFDTVIDNDDGSGVNTVYLQRNAGSDAYFGTNLKVNNSTTLQTADAMNINVGDTAIFPDGQYEICATITSFPGAPFNDAAQQCRSLIVSHGPRLSVFRNIFEMLYDHSRQGTALPNPLPITVQAPATLTTSEMSEVVQVI